jgi:hypothetical protein
LELCNNRPIEVLMKCALVMDIYDNTRLKQELRVEPLFVLPSWMPFSTSLMKPTTTSNN